MGAYSTLIESLLWVQGQVLHELEQLGRELWQQSHRAATWEVPCVLRSEQLHLEGTTETVPVRACQVGNFAAILQSCSFVRKAYSTNCCSDRR